MTLPRLSTQRLVLRPFVSADGPLVEELAGDRQVADTTLTIPHPYPRGGGAMWIATHADAWERRENLTLAVSLATDVGKLIGAIGLQINGTHRRAEIGYWVGQPWWGHGYATEAARAITDYGFRELGLHRIEGRHFSRNAASGRVLQKIGMRLEGVHRDALMRWDQFEDVVVYGLLVTERSSVLIDEG